MSDQGGVLPTADARKWVALFANRDEMAEEYASLLHRNGDAWQTWPTLNLAIMDRWSAAGLNYIKTRAWKIATGNL